MSGDFAVVIIVMAHQLGIATDKRISRICSSHVDIRNYGIAASVRIVDMCRNTNYSTLSCPRSPFSPKIDPGHYISVGAKSFIAFSKQTDYICSVSS